VPGNYTGPQAEGHGVQIRIIIHGEEGRKRDVGRLEILKQEQSEQQGGLSVRGGGKLSGRKGFHSRKKKNREWVRQSRSSRAQKFGKKVGESEVVLGAIFTVREERREKAVGGTDVRGGRGAVC